MIKVEKRNKTIVDFDGTRLSNAANAALNDTGHPDHELANRIAEEIENELNSDGITQISIKGLERRVEDKLMEFGRKDADSKDLKREALERNKEVFELLADRNDYLTKENSNKDPVILSTKRDYMAGIQSKEIVEKFIFDKDLIEAHKAGLIHIHDTDFIALNMHNCCVFNLEACSKTVLS